MPLYDTHHIVLLAGVAVLFVVLGVARRVPVLRTMVSVLSWIAFAAILLVLLGERERFDPYVGRIAAMLKLGDDQRVEGAETRLRMSQDGHFWVRAMIGGVERRMLVDSGATLTALSVGTANAAGLAVGTTPFPMLIKTANGTIRADTAQVGELRMGNIVARDLAVVVSPAFGDTDILGMNFLSRLKSWRVEGNTLILVPNHPQATPER